MTEPVGAQQGAAPELLRRYPQARALIPWTALGDLPTPVERIEPPGISDFPGELWIKRDDLSGRPYGGNKVRKLEFVLADALQAGAGRLITGGAVGSHHSLATTVFGGKLGFNVSLVLFPQSMTEHVRQILLLDHAMGADMRLCPKMAVFPLYMRLERWKHRDERTYVVEPGGSSPVGTLGYVSGGLEYAGQVERGDAPRPDAVYLAAGTLGTIAGLAIGFALAGLAPRIVGIRIVPAVVANERVLRRLVSQTLALLDRAGIPVPPTASVLEPVELRGDHLGRGYGYATEAGRDAAQRFQQAGFTLDPTYTAKAAAGLLDALGTARSGVHLFWNTLSSRVPEEALRSARWESLPPAFRKLADRTEHRAEAP